MLRKPNVNSNFFPSEVITPTKLKVRKSSTKASPKKVP